VDAYVIPVGSAPGGGFIFRDVVRLERQSSVVLLYRLPDPAYPKDMALLAVVPTSGVLVFFGDQPPERLPQEASAAPLPPPTKGARAPAKVAPQVT
jgi:hypothetical protein